MTTQHYDVCGLGNALVDVIAHIDEKFLAQENMIKGSMQLIDEAQAVNLYNKMPPATEISGGSAGNTIAAIAQMGGKTAFMGKVKADHLGGIFQHDLQSLGVKFASKPAVDGDATGRSYILVSPDGERTMNTFLGAAQGFCVEDLDAAVIEASKVTYLEGYLWDPLPAKAAFQEAARIAHGAGREVALTLSDTFCVERYRAEFLELMRNKTIQIIFANSHELLALYETSDFNTALNALRADVPLAVVTRGEHGAVAVQGEANYTVAAHRVDRVVDLTGAGDVFAAGFLHSYTQGVNLDIALQKGADAAAQVIQQIGARIV